MTHSTTRTHSLFAADHSRILPTLGASLAIAALLSCLPATAAGQIPVWQPVPNTVDSHRATAKIERVSVQNGPLVPAYVLTLDIDTGGAGTCPEGNVAYVPTGDGDPSDANDEELAWQIMDIAKLALATGRAVRVVIDGESQQAVGASGEKRCAVVRLALL